MFMRSEVFRVVSKNPIVLQGEMFNIFVLSKDFKTTTVPVLQKIALSVIQLPLRALSTDHAGVGLQLNPRD